MIISHVSCYAEAALVVLGFDKRKIGNKEIGRERVYAKSIIDVDELLSKGYSKEIIIAMLGQDLLERCFSNYFNLREDIRDYQKDGCVGKYLQRALTPMLFKEITEARLFFMSYLFSDKYSLTFADMVRAFFRYIDYDLISYKKLTTCSRWEGRAINRFIRKGGDPFKELQNEAECLWHDMIFSFKYSFRHNIPTSVFAFDDAKIEKGTENMFHPIQDIIKDKVYLYTELPKRRFLERSGITKEDTTGTSYEYLFSEATDELLTYYTSADFDWKWQTAFGEKARNLLFLFGDQL